MLICEPQTFSDNFYIDGTDNLPLFIYSDGKLEECGGEDELRGRYSSVNTESDSGISQSEWENVSGVEDDVFTEREVVLSFEGYEVTDHSTCDSLEPGTSQNHSETEYLGHFKQEVDDGETQMSLSSDFEISLDDIDAGKDSTINDIICSDSFLKWLDNDEGSDSNCEPFEDYTDSSEGVECLGTYEHSDSFQIKQPRQMFFSSTFDSQTKLPPIQTMIPPGSKIAHSFSSENFVQVKDSFNTLIRNSSTSLRLDNLVSSLVF